LVDATLAELHSEVRQEGEAAERRATAVDATFSDFRREVGELREMNAAADAALTSCVGELRTEGTRESKARQETDMKLLGKMQEIQNGLSAEIRALEAALRAEQSAEAEGRQAGDAVLGASLEKIRSLVTKVVSLMEVQEYSKAPLQEYLKALRPPASGNAPPGGATLPMGYARPDGIDGANADGLPEGLRPKTPWQQGPP